MKLPIALCVLAAAAAASASAGPTLAYVAPVAVAPVASQFHVQDHLGQYSYGYSNALSAKSEARSADGLTVGGYKFVDGDGKVQSVEYSSDARGFRVAASNLPVPPAVPEVPALPQPVPVVDTPEVVEARAKHLAVVEEVKARSTQVVTPLAAVSTLAVQPLVPVVHAAPVVALKSAPAAEASTTPAPAEEAKSAPAEAANATAAPAIELRSAALPAATLNTVLTPSLGLRTLSPVAFGYSFNTVDGVVSSIVQPAIAAYSLPLGAPLFATPVFEAATSKAAAPAEAAQETKEGSE